MSPVLQLGTKNFYKWFQKAIEFTTVYCVQSQTNTKLDSMKIIEPWAQLKKLRVNIGKKCNWADEKES